MAARYPAEQLAELQLPGFRREARIWDVASQHTDWQSVLSLSVYSQNPAGPNQIDVLTGIRQDDSETHPHVISTPTARFPQSFQTAVLHSRRDVAQEVDMSDSSHAHARDTFISPGHFRLDTVDTRENQTVISFLPNTADIHRLCPWAVPYYDVDGERE
jgi:hypothetical protein